MIRVAVVEDDARVRRILTEVLAAAKDCQCAGAFPDGKSAAAKLPALKPDVIIMDIHLPDISGVECVRELAPQLPETRIIMLTVYQDPKTIFQALAAGAHGYLVKPVMPEKLLDVIREMQTGGAIMSRAIARQVIEFFENPAPPPAPGAVMDDVGLAPREQQVVEYLVAGLSYKEIANELNIKQSTIANYVQRIYEKLHVRSRREIIARYKATEGGKPAN